MTTLRVRRVDAQELEDLNTFAVVLAENVDGSGARLELQRALEADEQDEQLGMNTYCIATERGLTHYGGVKRHALTDRQLVLELDDEASRTLQMGPRVVCSLEPGASDPAVLRAALDRIFVA